MKTVTRSILIAAAACAATSAPLVAQATDTLGLKVFGNCSMCKERIETALLAVPGVRWASWNDTTKWALVAVEKNKVQRSLLHKAVAAAGHDTEVEPADDKAYAALPECCQYERNEKLSTYQTDEVTVEARRESSSIDYAAAQTVTLMTKKELFKAACCNLSESFETNPSVDVTFTDAITGTRQIEMLGLAGVYSQITQEGLPQVRGLNALMGLNYIPGTWIESIQVARGVGSVANGYESITGQINVELAKPNEEQFVVNGYYNNSSRSEGNIVVARPLSESWSTALLLHGRILPARQDVNSDGFLDMPVESDVVAMSRWFYTDQEQFEFQFGGKYSYHIGDGGQVDFNKERDRRGMQFFGMETEIERVELFWKSGWVDPEQPERSVGLQLSGSSHDSRGFFGVNDFVGKNQTAYANLIGQMPLDELVTHKLRAGITWLFDRYDESMFGGRWQRTESVPGVWTEYSYTPNLSFNLVAGLRADAHNLYGTFVTPRLHLRWAPVENTVLRASGGRGQRTANIFAENMVTMISSRMMYIDAKDSSNAYGLSPEVAWNVGGSVTQYFDLDDRQITLAAEFFHTSFSNQIVVDLDRSPHEVWISNLNGSSYSNSFQIELTWPVVATLPLRFAYRYLDVQAPYAGTQQRRPMIPEHRLFANAAFEPGDGWMFDATVQWFGKRRLPSTASSAPQYQRPEFSPSYAIINAQISKTIVHNLDFYVGVENLNDYRQANPIIAADKPFSPHFDPSFVWAPIFGRTVYAGFRFMPFQTAETDHLDHE